MAVRVAPPHTGAWVTCPHFNHIYGGIMAVWRRFFVRSAWPGVALRDITLGTKVMYPYPKRTYFHQGEGLRSLQLGEVLCFDRHQTAIVVGIQS